ncbi:unnamed protein product [Pleuronectes platessa]|uniref:Uncharacterized protein n=1 Tax=Pleuronectes platessa TaxID=8262 RepID=A0A9N7YIH5_PLEPL|nr:unnamed protein product [Pleuronectes platessa]
MRGGTTKLKQRSLRDGGEGDERRRPLGARAFDALSLFEASQKSGWTEKSTEEAERQEQTRKRQTREVLSRDNEEKQHGAACIRGLWLLATSHSAKTQKYPIIPARRLNWASDRRRRERRPRSKRWTVNSHQKQNDEVANKAKDVFVEQSVLLHCTEPGNRPKDPGQLQSAHIDTLPGYSATKVRADTQGAAHRSTKSPPIA